MTILILAHNEKDMVIKCIEHFRKLRNNGFNFSLILADNASTDGLVSWATEQIDFVYYKFIHFRCTNMKPWSNIINVILNKFDIDDQILIMKPNFFPAEIGCLDELSKILNEDEKCAIVSPVATIESTYDESIYGKFKEVNRAIKPSNNFLLIKKDIFNKIDTIEDIWNMSAFILSIIIQITKIGYIFKVLNIPVLKDPYNYFEDIDSKSHENEDKKLLEKKFGIHYFSGINYYITKLLEQDNEDKEKALKVLEVGCDSGATLLHIKNMYHNATTIGCDINPNIIEIASHCIDKAFIADIENDNIPIEPESLDYVIFGDVLEHLRHPERALQIANILLKPGGKVIASIPNTMHISVMKDLLNGNFTYQEYGLLDKTHIHLFTLFEIQKMFIQNGYAIEIAMYNQQKLSEDDEKLIDKLMEISDKAVQRYMYIAYQYQIKARKVV